MRRLVFGHITANVVRCAEFAAANLSHGVPYLWFEPNAGPVSVDAHIANYKRAVSLRIFVRSEKSAGKGRNHGSHPWMQCRARFTTVGSTTINSGLLISGLRAHTAVILAENWRCFCASHTPILMDDFPTIHDRRPAHLRSPKAPSHFPSPTSVRGHPRGQGSPINAQPIPLRSRSRAPLTRCERAAEENSLSGYEEKWGGAKLDRFGDRETSLT